MVIVLKYFKFFPGSMPCKGKLSITLGKRSRAKIQLLIEILLDRAIQGKEVSVKTVRAQRL